MSIVKKIQSITKIIDADNIFVYSAQASFYIIISSIPFIMLLLSLAQFVLPISEQDIFRLVVPLMPEVIKEPVQSIISELFYKSSGSVISITAISTLWPASRGISAIERGIRNVYHTPSRRAIFLDIASSIFYTLIFIIIVILFLATTVFGTSIIIIFF